MVEETHIVPKNVSGQRLSDYAVGIFQSVRTRKGIKKAISAGRVRLDGHRAYTGHWVRSGQVIELCQDDRTPPRAYHAPLSILYQDSHLAVVDKPPGMVVSGSQFRTLQNLLVHHLPATQVPSALPWPLPAHRLDAPTGGLVMVARSRCARVALGEALAQHHICKTYHALCVGKVPDECYIHLPVAGKSSYSSVKRLSTTRSLRYQWLSLVRLQPHTGRTHQLRIHMAAIGHAIVGDQQYAKPPASKVGKGLFLCATGLDFVHPITGEAIQLKLPIPHKFTYLQEREAHRWNLHDSQITS